jgi:flagellar protein FliO/FliZ
VTGLLGEAAPLLRTAAALAAVILLLLMLAWLARRHGAGRLATMGAGRLAVTASQALDARVRLVLVRCDAVEHLLAVGPAGVTLIETLPSMQRDEAA